MPQMAPMNWLILFMYLLCILYMIMNLMFFNYNKIIKTKNLKLKLKNNNKFI